MEYDFCEELKGCYKDSVFDSETLRYYLNGLIDAVNIPLEKGNITFLGFYEHKTVLSRYSYISDKFYKKIDDKSGITISKNKSKRKEWLNIIYQDNNDLKLSLDIYYKRNKTQNSDLQVLPFKLDISLLCGNNIYGMIARCQEFGTDFATDFYFAKYNNYILNSNYYKCEIANDSLTVYRSDFENVLKVLMQFLNNPEIVMEHYSINKKGLILRSSNIDTIDDSIKLDNKGRAYQKILK